MAQDTYKVVLKDLKEKYQKQALTTKEVSKELGINEGTFRNCIREGKNVPEFRLIGVGERNKRAIFPIHSVAKFLANTEQPTY